MMKMQMLGGAVSLLMAMYAFMVPGEKPIDKVADSTPFEVRDAAPAPQFRQQAEIAGSAVAKLDQMLQMIQAGEQARLEGDQARAEVVAQVNSLAQMVKAVTQKVDEQSLTKDDVVKLVSTTVTEETGKLKSEFGECDCNCQEKLAEVTKELNDLKQRVKALEEAAAKVTASSSTQITAGMDPTEVAAKLKAMGYQSAAYATRTVTSSGGGGCTGSMAYNASTSYSTAANTASYGGCTGSVAVPQQVFTPPPAPCVPCQQQAAVQSQVSYDASYSTSATNSTCVKRADGTMDCSGGGGGNTSAGGGFLGRVKARFGR